MTAADDDPDRGADDDIGLDAVGDEGADDADMGKSARAAAAERKPDGGAFSRPRGRPRACVGAAVPVACVALLFEGQGKSLRCQR